MKAFGLAFCMGLAVAVPAWAEQSQAEQAERWRDLKLAVFGDRPVTEGTGVIALEAPARAQDASLVPITISLPAGGGTGGGRVKAVWVLVDGNPSPLAGTFKFGPAADPHTLRTRVRVDQYTLMHAVAETEDGRLFGAERYVKAAGGCSAPSLKDPKLAMSRLGQMRLRVDGDGPVQDGQAATAQLLVSHPPGAATAARGQVDGDGHERRILGAGRRVQRDDAGAVLHGAVPENGALQVRPALGALGRGFLRQGRGECGGGQCQAQAECRCETLHGPPP